MRVWKHLLKIYQTIKIREYEDWKRERVAKIESENEDHLKNYVTEHKTYTKYHSFFSPSFYVNQFFLQLKHFHWFILHIGNLWNITAQSPMSCFL